MAPNATVLSGLGMYVPPNVVTNDDLSKVLDTNDEWISTRTGIKERRIIDPGQSVLDIGVPAAKQAIAHFGGGDFEKGASQIDMVVMATFTPDRLCPATAPEIASRLGLGYIPAYDVGAVCSGFLYGSLTAQGLIATGQFKNVLVLGAEVISPQLRPDDRSTRIIFGDAAGAVVFSAGEQDQPGVLGPFDIHADGDNAELIARDAGAGRTSAAEYYQQSIPVDDDWFITMQGKEVYIRAVPGMKDSTLKAIEMRGWEVEDLDLLIAHQANLRIIEAIAKRLKLAPEQVFVNINKYGNTAGASIPVAMAEAHQSRFAKANDKTILTAFGAGLTWGSTTLVWPDLPPMPEGFTTI